MCVIQIMLENSVLGNIRYAMKSLNERSPSTMSDRTEYAASLIKLIDSFAPCLLSKIEIKKHNHFILVWSELSSHIKKSELHSLQNCGFLSEFEGTKNKIYLVGDLVF